MVYEEVKNSNLIKTISDLICLWKIAHTMQMYVEKSLLVQQ